MSEEELKEIKSLLESIFVFEIKFKAEISAKAEKMDHVKLKKLKSILSDVGQWQENALNKTIRENVDFYNKIVGAKKKADQNIISLYKQKLSADDHKKMEIILDRIKSV